MYSFTSINPQPALQPFVKQFILYEGNSNSCVIQNLIPGNFQNICFVLNGSMQLYTVESRLPILKSYVLGQTSQSYKVTYDENIKVLVIYFKPTGMYQLFGIPMSKFTNHRIDFELIVGVEEKYLIEKIFEATDLEHQIKIIEEYLLQKVEKKPGFSAKRIEYASHLIQQHNGNIKLKYLLSQVNMCERNFERCFIEEIGVSPKTFSGIVRINKALQMIESMPKYTWGDITYQLNYTDPSHFSHDFKKFSGKTPTDYYHSKGDLENFLYGS
jgi:AraC-like DNA-binding protein